MGIPPALKDIFTNRASPVEDEQLLRTKEFTEENGISPEMKDVVANRKKYWLIASPVDNDIRIQKDIEEAQLAGLKAAAITCVATTLPIRFAVQKFPAVKKHFNWRAQLIVVSFGNGHGCKLSSIYTLSNGDAVFSDFDSLKPP